MKKTILLLLCCAVYWSSHAGTGDAKTGYVFKYVNSCHYADGDRSGTTEPLWFVDENLKNTIIGYAFDAGNTVCCLMNDDESYNPYISYGFSKSENGFRTYNLSPMLLIDLGDEMPLFLSVNADFSVLTLTGSHGENDSRDRTDFYTRVRSGITSRPVEEDSADDEIYVVVEQMPGFQGGDLYTFLKWVQVNRQRPANSPEGRVIAKFVVEKDGTLSNIRIVHSPDQALSDEALRVLKLSPRLTPGKYAGKTVRVECTLPVDFVDRN